MHQSSAIDASTWLAFVAIVLGLVNLKPTTAPLDEISACADRRHGASPRRAERRSRARGRRLRPRPWLRRESGTIGNPVGVRRNDNVVRERFDGTILEEALGAGVRSPLLHLDRQLQAELMWSANSTTTVGVRIGDEHLALDHIRSSTARRSTSAG